MDAFAPSGVGRSFAGRLTLIVRFAMDYPDLVTGLVIVAGSVDPDLVPFSPWWEKTVDDHRELAHTQIILGE